MLTLIRAAKKLMLLCSRSHTLLFRQQIGEREALHHAVAIVGSLHLERARDCQGSSRTAWWADYWQGVAWAEGSGGGSQRSQISPPSCRECTIKAQKWPVSKNYWLKIAENAVVYLQVLNKIYSWEVFQGIHEFFVCYIRWGYFIPIKSFGSHIRPQPPGIGLN